MSVLITTILVASLFAPSVSLGSISLEPDQTRYDTANNTTDEDLYESIERMQELSPGTLFCYDILIAGVDYENFVEYMESFNQIHEYDQNQEAEAQQKE